MNISKIPLFGCLILVLISLGLLALISKPVWPLFFHPPIPWSDGVAIDPEVYIPWGFNYAAQLQDSSREFLSESGERVTLPDRLIMCSQDELDREVSTVDARSGQSFVRVPKTELDFNLDVVALQTRVDQYNDVYSTDSPDWSKAVLYVERLKDHNGLPTFVMARLTAREAFRSVWSVDPKGRPIPLTFAYTNDRNGYHYHDSISRKNALEDRLLLP